MTLFQAEGLNSALAWTPSEHLWPTIYGNRLCGGVVGPTDADNGLQWAPVEK